MTITKSALLAGSLALGLAACNDSTPAPEPSEVPVNVPRGAEYDPMTGNYTLTPEAQVRRDAMDPAAVETEYAGYRSDVMKERVRTGARTDASTEMTDDDRAELQAASQQRDSKTNMRTRENMTWSYLDRNKDGKLSVAEYAIWAIPLDPNAPARNDEKAPYLTADQANKAGDSFFYYDQDGDTYLSQREFTAARRGETVPSAGTASPSPMPATTG